MIIPFGFYKDNTGVIHIDNEKATTIRLIFDLYTSGYSLGMIVSYLADNHILSPTGKEKWTVQAIDNLLSNEKYMHIISAEQYVKAQLEKQKRSNKTKENIRKTTRYNSNDVLSGLLVCRECGRSYRRITRKSGEVVWCCANRVENGKQAVCQNMHTISEQEIKIAICDYLEIVKYDADEVKNKIDHIEIGYNNINFILKSEQLFGICQ